jgi:hypothetical protein
MKRFDLVKRPDGWATESDGRTVRGTKAPTKAQAVQQARAAARRAPEPISLKIHQADGRIQEERTYVRSADPRSSRG